MSAKVIDDATTCEQYVVAKLKFEEATVKRLNETIMELNCEIEKLEAERDSEIAKFIRKTGRNEIVRSSRSWSTNGKSVTRDGKIKTFEDWAKGYVDNYPAPQFMTQDEFICEFKPELSEIYDNLVYEAKEEDE
jgi:hypothetical protein